MVAKIIYDYIIIPKNSGLAVCKNISDEYTGEILEVRGEDVPLFVLELTGLNKKVIGITGEDLLKEFLLENKNTGITILKTIPWEDSSCLFGKPTLCLLGDSKKKFEDLNKNLRVCINRKYSRIAKKYLARLEDRGYSFEKIYLSGATESTFKNNLVDLVIDIVYSGKSASEVGLVVYDKIFSSDIVVLSALDIPKKVVASEGFDLEELYNKIKNKIESSDENSYTRKLVSDKELLKRKIIEEAAEVITSKNKEELIWECADLLYFLLVYMVAGNVDLEEVYKENLRRDKK